jgi:nucleoside phosphorylase
MPKNTFQAISKGSGIQHTGALPGAIALAEIPQRPKTAAYEGIEGGAEIAWVVVLTALGAEHKAVEAHLEPFRKGLPLEEDKHSNGTIYTKGRFTTPSCQWNVAIAQIDMGNDSAAIEAIRAIEHFNPKVILFVGVAGGIKDVEIGDVVAASVIYGYDCGKALSDRMLPRPKLGEATYDLKQRAMAEARKEDWRSRIPSDLSPSAKPPRIYTKPIAAGEKVLASRQAEIYAYLREYYDDAIAVEMEGFGFLKAAQQAKNVSAIVIRGISDLIDNKNDDTIEPEAIRQTRAAHHASAFAFELLAKLEGTTIPESAVSAEYDRPFSLDDQSLPDHLARLSIELLEGGSCFIRAHLSRQDFVEHGKFATELAQLLTRIESSINPVNLVGEVDDCNEELQNHQDCPIGQFLQWLPQQTNGEAGDELCLVIDDRTSLGIPWELLQVGEIPLGVAVQTIHECAGISKPNAMTPCCQGEVLAYASTGTQRWQTAYRHRHHSEFEEFLRHLQQPQTDYGLVYIDAMNLREKLRLNPTAFIKRSRLLKTRASLVFVAGQVSFDESLPLNHAKFLHLFLRYGAKGVIGCLKRVDTNAARQIAEIFFAGFKQQPSDSPATVPAMLRQMRQNVHDRLNNEELCDDLCALYLATFLYVYYGDPQTLLHLIPADN